MRHLVPERIFQLTRDRVFCPGMKEGIYYHIQKFLYSVKKKSFHQKHIAPFVPSLKPPFEIVGIESFILILHQLLFVGTEHFTKYAQTWPTRNKSEKGAAEIIDNDFFLRIKMTEKMLSDQGGDLQNNLFKHLSQLFGVKQLCSITFYHPQVNVQTEWQNSNISEMLEKHKSNTKRLLERSY